MRIVLVFVSMLFALLPALGQEPATKQADINKSLVRRAFQAMEQGDLKTLNEVFNTRANPFAAGKDLPAGRPIRGSEELLSNVCGSEQPQNDD